MKAKIVFIIDRSGSMGGLESDVIGGFNSFIEEQKKIKGEADVSLVLFDHEYITPVKNVDINHVKMLNEDTYTPRGTTALLDAVGKTIDDVGKDLDEMKQIDRPDKVIVCIITDGYENSSCKYTTQQIKEKVEHQQNKYSWEFIFFAANMDAFAEGGSLGFKFDNISNYENTDVGNRVAYASMSSMVAGYRTDQKTTV